MQKPQEIEPIKENEDGLTKLSSSLVREDESVELDINETWLSPWSSVYQGPPTHALQKSLNKHTLDTAEVNRLGRGEIKQGDVTIFIEKFKEARENLRPSVPRLFYAGVRELAKKNAYKNTPRERILYTIDFSLSDYMKLRGVHDERMARRQVKADCEALISLSAKWEETRGKGDVVYFKLMNFFGGAELENGIITLKFNPEFADYLINKAYEMKLPKLYFQINDKNNPYSASMLEYLSTRKRQTRGRKAEDIISVRALAEYAGVPIDSRKAKERAIEPMERDLDALDSVLTWHYCQSKGEKLTEEQNKNFTPDIFRKSYIKITWHDYPLSEYDEAQKEVETAHKEAIRASIKHKSTKRKSVLDGNSPRE